MHVLQFSDSVATDSVKFSDSVTTSAKSSTGVALIAVEDSGTIFSRIMLKNNVYEECDV